MGEEEVAVEVEECAEEEDLDVEAHNGVDAVALDTL